MGTQLDFKLSLVEMAASRVVANLWTEWDILAYFKKLSFKLFRNNAREREWQSAAENKVRLKVSKLGFNAALTQKIESFVSPIGEELLRWKLFNEDLLGMWCQDFREHVYRLIFWTPAASIDYQKTARELVRLGMLDAVKRYKLACLFCLEEHVPAIWEELSEDSRKSFCKLENPLLVRELQMENYWANLLREEEEEDFLMRRVPVRRIRSPDTFYQRAFEYAAIRGNKAATEYFFSKLTPEEREVAFSKTVVDIVERRSEESPCKSSKELFIELSTGTRELPGVQPLIDLIEIQFADERQARARRRIKGSFPKEKLSDVFCYLFFRMTPSQQMGICAGQPFKVLRCFLEWPWKGILTDMADLVWTFVPESSYDDLLDMIECTLKFPDDHFSRTFRELFPRSPVGFRKQFIERECRPTSYTFPKILHCNAAETAKVILRNVDYEDRVKLIINPRFFRRYQYFNADRDSLMIQFLLREAGLSREERENLKKSYMEYFEASDGAVSNEGSRVREIRMTHRKRFCDAIDEMNDGGTSKRSADEGTSTESKKTCAAVSSEDSKINAEE